MAYAPCYETHPVLEFEANLPDGKTSKVSIMGGSCTGTRGSTARIFIGFDAGMQRSGRRYPWKPGHEFCYPIRDRGVPPNPEIFQELVEWVAEQLLEGETVYVGCIGGHGRTGLFLAALVKTMTGNEDAITFVREHYCGKAVESAAQVSFLVEHYGVKKVPGADSLRNKVTKLSDVKQKKLPLAPPKSKGGKRKPSAKTVVPMPCEHQIHGENLG